MKNGTYILPKTSIARIHERLIATGVLSREQVEWERAENERVRLEIANGVAPPTDDRLPDLTALLERIRFNPSAAPTAPMALYSLAGNVIATAENIMVVQAKMKAGKSAAIGAMLSSTMEPTGDCLGFASSNAGGLGLVHCDTEQSSYDHYNLILRSIRRAGRASPPPWFASYYLKGQSIRVAKALFAAAIDRAAQRFGGIHSAFCDGIADLCADVNDAAESNALVAEMEALAMKYKTLIVCVLHENHASDSGKTRGHLGSQLARKAETNLRLEKNAEGTTLMYADTSRSVHITKKNAPGFAWDDDAQAHVSALSTVGAVAADKARDEMRVLAEHVLGSAPAGVAWADFRNRVTTILSVSERTAERAIRKMQDFFIITKKEDRYFLC